MSGSTTTVVVQSGDLAAWVGAASGLAGVILGAGIEASRQRRTARDRKRSDLIRAGSRLATATTAYRRAAAAAGSDQNDPGWRALLDSHMADMAAAATTITETGNQDVIDASLAIVKHIYDADLATPEGTIAAAAVSGDAIRSYRDTVRKARL